MVLAGGPGRGRSGHRMDVLLMALQALTITAVAGNFNVLPDIFYRVDASGGPVVATLPLASTTTASDWNVIKKIDSSANTVTITPTPADQINQTSTNVLTSQNQSHQLFPNTPAGGNLIGSVTPAAGIDDFGNQFLAGIAAYGDTTATELAADSVDFFTGSRPGGWTEETNHVIGPSLNHGWTGTINVQFLPIGQGGIVTIDADLVPGTVADGTVIWTLGGMYSPKTFKRIGMGCDCIKVSPVIGSGSFEAPNLFIGASGELQCFGVGTGATYFQGSSTYPVGF